MATIKSRNTVVRGARTAAAAGIAAAALTALCAPAGATGTRVGVEPGISFGSATNYGTSCTYAVNGYVDDPSTPVVFFDNGIPFARVVPSGKAAQARWTPGTTGVHRLQIVQHSFPGEDVVPYVDITVGTGLSSGSGCNVLH